MHSWLLVLALQVAVGLLAGLSLRLFFSTPGGAMFPVDHGGSMCW
jgi:hypothetical protein